MHSVKYYFNTVTNKTYLKTINSVSTIINDCKTNSDIRFVNNFIHDHRDSSDISIFTDRANIKLIRNKSYKIIDAKLYIRRSNITDYDVFRSHNNSSKLKLLTKSFVVNNIRQLDLYEKLTYFNIQPVINITTYNIPFKIAHERLKYIDNCKFCMNHNITTWNPNMSQITSNIINNIDGIMKYNGRICRNHEFIININGMSNPHTLLSEIRNFYHSNPNWFFDENSCQVKIIFDEENYFYDFKNFIN